MAIYHASIKAVQRSAGRSATAAAAYRAACQIVDTRTGEVHDYARKGGVLHAELRLPGGQAPDRAEFWNRIEAHHKRGDAVVARELVIALPDELGRDEQIHLSRQMAAALAKHYSVGVDVCVHMPSRSGDDRNVHAHILMSACLVDQAGELGKKCEPLDPIHCARRKLPSAAEWVRPVWEKLANEALARAGQDARIDHRSHEARGLDEAPGQHHGPAVTDMLRSGAASDVAQRQADEAARIAARLLARQVLDAQAAAERLEAQAAQTQADLEAELEIERVQVLREAAEAAEQARAAQERAQAWAEHDQAAQAQERARAAVEDAERARQALWPAYNAATVGQREAGASMRATVRALPKAAGWKRAIDAYNNALDALDHAQKVLARAGQRLVAALARLEAVHPEVREARETREKATMQAYEAQQRRIAEASAAAAAAHALGRERGVPVDVAHQDEDDQERPT